MQSAEETQDEQQWSRLKSAFDTGSSSTFIEACHVAKLNVASRCKFSGRIVALDGNSLPVMGTVRIRLRRQGGPVYLPCVEVVALVVESLSTVSASMLIGSDVVAGA